MLTAGFEARASCAHCLRPQSVCYCRHLTSLETATRIVLLQHPRERDMPIGTARMASLCLPNAELHVGIDWQGSPALARALSDPSRPAALLYPGEGAIDVVRNPPPGPITLIVVDGTWWQTRKLVRKNPVLAALPRYAFTPPSPSEYRIRREPDDTCVSTIEALAHVLGALEGDPARFRALLEPFRAMVDAQLDCEKRFHGARLRHRKAEKPSRPRVPPLLGDRAGDLVSVVGEANAWPYRATELRTEYSDELVHWAARRLKTGETFDFVVAPKNPLAPSTPIHTRLSPDLLAAGGTVQELMSQWRSFVRDTDVICSWGRYGTSLFADAGGHLPAERIDLRHVARVFTRGKVGTLEGFAASIGAPSSPSPLRGRAGVRLLQVAEIAGYFSAAAGREAARRP
jgi:DTW domain-containing protein YfiP